MKLTKRKILCFSLVSTVCFFIFVEMSARVFDAYQQRSLAPLSYGSYKLTKVVFGDLYTYVSGQSRLSGTQQLENERRTHLDENQSRQAGEFIRGHFHTYHKPPATYRILVYGGSSVFSVTTSFERSFPSILAQKLNAQQQKIKYEVLNMGVPGIRSNEIIAKQQEGFRFEHDLEIFYFMANDLAKPHIVSNRQDLMLHSSCKILYKLSLAFSKIYRRINHLGIYTPPTERAKHFAKIYSANNAQLIKACKKNKIKVTIVEQSIDIEHQNKIIYKDFNFLYQTGLQVVKDLSKKFNVPIIYTRQNLLKRTTHISPQNTLFYDIVHLTEKGNAILAGTIYEGLKKNKLLFEG